MNEGEEPASHLRNALGIPIWSITATLTLKKLRRWDDHE
jgi:hypothetical protein